MQSNCYEERGVAALLVYVRRARSTACGCKSRPNLMEVKGSEAQGRHREVGSEGSVEQRYGPMYKNRIRGLRRRTSWHMTTKSVSIKDAGGKSGGRVSKAVELIAGELLHRLEFVTEGGVIHPDPAAAVSSGRSTHASEEGPNSKGE